MKTVLFITYNFPPAGGAGVQRSLKFIKYLPQFGWQPVVITAMPENYPIHDESLWKDIPENTPIYRAKSYDINGLRPFFTRFKLAKIITAINIMLMLPDAAIFWTYSARSTIRKAIQQHQPSLIYSSSGPASAHILARWAKKTFTLPWLADFRDPWSENLLSPYLPGYRSINRKMEKEILAAADSVACVTQPWLDDLKHNLGRNIDKFFVLPNGYDEADVQPLPYPSDNSRFTLTYLGSFYRNRRPNNLIKAIETLIQTQRIPVVDIRVLFIGKNVRQFVPHIPPFEVHNYVPHEQLNYFRLQSDAFILLLDTSPKNIGNHSGKLFEYMASNRPILGIVPKGGAAQHLIEETRTGISVGDDVEEIAEAINKLYEQWKRKQFIWNPDWNVIRQYTRRKLTQRLAAEFERLTTNLERKK